MDPEGKRGRAAEHLRRLLGQDDWIDALASQELARLHIKQGRLKDARTLLEASIERHSQHEQALRVLLAYALDRAKRPDAARRQLSASGRQVATGPTPRALYNRWPSEALGETRALLRSAVVPTVSARTMTTVSATLPE